VELRYYLGAAHYRSNIEFSAEALDEAAAAYHRIENFIERAKEALGGPRHASGSIVPDEFAAAMDDDLGVPAALGVTHSRVRDGNTALDSADLEDVDRALRDVVAMTAVLGIEPGQWQQRSSSDLTQVVDALVGVALEQRAAARARKDYAAADAIRDQLTEAGIAVEDTPSGPRWTLKDHQ
jgi:cysteinyl-tRNA synthetase